MREQGGVRTRGHGVRGWLEFGFSPWCGGELVAVEVDVSLTGTRMRPTLGPLRHHVVARSSVDLDFVIRVTPTKQFLPQSFATLSVRASALLRTG